jgi:hypothetical protein
MSCVGISFFIACHLTRDAQAAQSACNALAARAGAGLS